MDIKIANLKEMLIKFQLKEERLKEETNEQEYSCYGLPDMSEKYRKLMKESSEVKEIADTTGCPRIDVSKVYPHCAKLA